MNQNGKVTYVPIAQIKPAAFNPPTRTSHKSISDLKSSIERVGILQPLIVTKEMDLVDGHRRLECAKMIGMEAVPVIVREGQQTDLFNELNTTSKRLNKADDLFVYLSGGSMTGRSKQQIEITERLVGREFLEYMAENRISPASVTSILGTVMKYVGKDPNWREGGTGFASKTARWLIEKKQQFAIRAAIVNHVSPSYIIECIENDKGI